MERLFYNCDYHAAFKLSSGIIKADPYHARALPIHVAFHQQALVLSPLNLSTYSALGYVQTLTNDLTAAVESFHKALGIRREDTFSTNMLNYVIEQLMSEVAPFPGYPEETPRFPPLKSPSGCLNLDTTAGNLSPSATPPLATDSQHTLADTSNLSFDCEMEDTGDTSREQEGLRHGPDIVRVIGEYEQI